MRIAILSDLHIGGGGKADDFKGDKVFMRRVRSLKADRIYLAGDIYELWQFPIKAIRAAHFLLCRFLKGRKFHWLRGNHDYQLLGPMTKTLKTKSGKRVLISHGFQNDKLMTNPFARAFIWLIGKTFEKWYPDLDNENGFKHKQNKSRTVRNTLKYAEKMWEKYDIVILGHSHRQRIEKSCLGKTYANCGTCSNNKFEGVILDTLTDKIQLI